MGPHYPPGITRSVWLFGPRADSWRWQSPFGSQADPLIQLDVHPQPLPPKALVFAAIAQEVADLALLMQDVADAILSRGKRRGIIIIEGNISKFVDEFCGSGFRMPWPFPSPRRWWLPEEVSGLDLAAAGVQFQKIASETFDSQLKEIFAGAGTKLTKAGLSRLQ